MALAKEHRERAGHPRLRGTAERTLHVIEDNGERRNASRSTMPGNAGFAHSAACDPVCKRTIGSAAAQ